MKIWLLLPLLLSACEKSSTSPGPRPVRTEMLHLQGAQEEHSFTGVLHAELEAKLSFRVAGTVQELFVEVGDHVSTGQVLARLDPHDYELQVEEANSALLEAEAVKRKAETNYARIKELYETESSSLADLDNARADFESSTAALQKAASRLEQAKTKLSYTKLQTPLPGAVAETFVEAGENVQSGSPIVELHAGDRLEVTVGIPEHLIHRIEPGQQATIFPTAVPEVDLEAVVTNIGVTSTGSTTYPVTMQLLGSAPFLRAGMSVSASLALPRERESLLTIPSHAVVQEGDITFVFVAEEGRVRKRFVELGPLSSEGFSVRDGLQPGERLVTAGTQFLHDGQQVRIVADREE